MEEDSFVTAAAEDQILQTDILQGGHLASVGRDGASLFAGVDVPDFDGIISAGTGQCGAIRLPRDVHDMVRMAFEGTDEGSGSHIKHLDEFVCGGAGQQASIG